jgi:RNA polymerase-binding transcription factor DksA
VDGGPIELKRLEAIPWALYCVRHQKLREVTSRPKPTL